MANETGIPAAMVYCRFCSQKKRQPCVDKNGERIDNYHVKRIQDAKRMYGNVRDKPIAFWTRPTGPSWKSLDHAWVEISLVQGGEIRAILPRCLKLNILRNGPRAKRRKVPVNPCRLCVGTEAPNV